MKTNPTKLLFLFIAFLAVNYAQAQCPGGQSQVTVTIVEDNYGSESSWTLTDGVNTILSGGPYVDGNSGTSHVEQACVPVGTACVFTMSDAYGDGMCCSYGNGSFTVTMNGCNTVASGAQFASEDITNFTVTAQPSVDLSLNSLDIAPIIVMGSVAITGEIVNLGATDVTSFTLNYSINNGTAVTQTINTTVASCGTYTYNHSTPWNASTAGNFDVKVWITNVSGGDVNPANDELTQPVIVATQSVPHLPVIEEFTSSTCAPCASFNSTFDPMLQSINTNTTGAQAAAVKYQMNWPSPGNDPSYNPDGNTRKTFYGVSGIPAPFLDGAETDGSQGAIDAAASKAAFVNLALSYTLNYPNQVDVTAVVTPYANLTGNVKLLIAVTEDYYSYPASTTSQDEFHYVERKMLPNGTGNTLSGITAGTPITVNKNYTFTLGSPAQGNYNLWGSDMNGITIVAFVQNMDTKEIYQAAFADSPSSVGISEEAAAVGLQVYPNPFSNSTNINYNVEGMQNVNVRVYNVTGQEVYSNDFGKQNAGTHNFQINADNLSAGIYVMNLTIGNKTVSHKLSVTK